MLTGDTEGRAKAGRRNLGWMSTTPSCCTPTKVDQCERLLGAKAPGAGSALCRRRHQRRAGADPCGRGMPWVLLGPTRHRGADIVLMDDNPAKIVTAMRISRKTLRIVKQNIWFALGVKFAVLALGALGQASMWAAVFADVGVAFLAILNATRCLRVEEFGK